MAGKYTPLEKYLSDLPESTREITLTFEQIEKILADKLPQSAYDHRAWWANERDGNHVHAHAWLNVGWKVESVDQNRVWVKFQRA
jgi:hypothetical protein